MRFSKIIKNGPVFNFKKGKNWTSFWLYSIYICLHILMRTTPLQVNSRSTSKKASCGEKRMFEKIKANSRSTCQPPFQRVYVLEDKTEGLLNLETLSLPILWLTVCWENIVECPTKCRLEGPPGLPLPSHTPAQEALSRSIAKRAKGWGGGGTREGKGGEGRAVARGKGPQVELGGRKRGQSYIRPCDQISAPQQMHQNQLVVHAKLISAKCHPGAQVDNFAASHAQSCSHRGLHRSGVPQWERKSQWKYITSQRWFSAMHIALHKWFGLVPLKPWNRAIRIVGCKSTAYHRKRAWRDLAHLLVGFFWYFRCIFAQFCWWGRSLFSSGPQDLADFKAIWAKGTPEFFYKN